jgi:putative ABC transport system permease protein
VLAAAGWAYLRLDENGGVRFERQILVVDPVVVLFPLLLVTGSALLVVRLFDALLPYLGRAATRLPAAAYLAARRLAGSRVATAGIVAAVALPLGLLVLSGSLTASVEETTLAKVRTYVGAPVALRTAVPPGTPVDVGGRATKVTVILDGFSGGLEMPVLGVDPDTFARYAYWQDDFAAAPLPDLLGRLGPPGRGESIRAILAGAGPTRTVDTVTMWFTDYPVRVVARTEAFPGMRLQRAPLLIVDERALAQVAPDPKRVELWTSQANAAGTLAALRGLEVQATSVRPADILSQTRLYPITWTFGYLQGLAALAGAISVTGLMLYLAARQRSRLASYALGRRMGVGRGTHLASLIVGCWWRSAWRR